MKCSHCGKSGDNFSNFELGFSLTDNVTEKKTILKNEKYYLCEKCLKKLNKKVYKFLKLKPFKSFTRDEMVKFN